MFTGIIEEIGIVKYVRKGIKSAFLSIEGIKIPMNIKEGDSVATNGVCLTVTAISGNIFNADVMNETLSRSSLGMLKVGSEVNLERAMPINGRFDGHIVSGHIDGTGKIINIRKEDIAVWYTIQTTSKIMRYIIEKGSIAIDGISLTVTEVSQNSFKVSVIPHTAKETTLLKKSIGSLVNIENDIIGKYVEKLFPNKKELILQTLEQNGF